MNSLEGQVAEKTAQAAEISEQIPVVEALIAQAELETMTLEELRAKLLELTTDLEAAQKFSTDSTTLTNTAVAAEAEATAALDAANMILNKYIYDKMPVETIDVARAAVDEATAAL